MGGYGASGSVARSLASNDAPSSSPGGSSGSGGPTGVHAIRCSVDQQPPTGSALSFGIGPRNLFATAKTNSVPATPESATAEPSTNPFERRRVVNPFDDNAGT